MPNKSLFGFRYSLLARQRFPVRCRARLTKKAANSGFCRRWNGLSRRDSPEFAVNFAVSREFRPGDRFAADCLHSQPPPGQAAVPETTRKRPRTSALFPVTATPETGLLARIVNKFPVLARVSLERSDGGLTLCCVFS